MFDFFDGSIFSFGESSVDDTDNITTMTEEEDAVMEAFESVPCTEDNIDDAMMRIQMEAVENYHLIVEAIMYDEINEYMVTHEEVVYEESRIKKITSAIADYIERAWTKIKGVYDKVLTTISNAVKNDAKFIKDNEKAIKAFSGKLDVKGYNFKNLQAKPCLSVKAKFDSAVKDLVDLSYINKQSADKIAGNKDAINNAVDGLADKLRGAAIGEDKCDASDFSSKLKKYFAGSDEKVTLDPNPTDIIAEISAAKESKAAAKASYDSVKEYFNGLRKAAKRMEKFAVEASSRTDVKESGLSKALGAFNKACKDAVAVVNVIVHAQIKAINASRVQAKAIAREMIAKSGKKDDKKSTNESALDLIQLA